MSLVDQLKTKFKDRKGDWIAGGSIEKWVTNETKYTPSNARRRLRELVEDGYLHQKEEKFHSVNHAFYKFDPEHVEKEYKYTYELDPITNTMVEKKILV